MNPFKVGDIVYSDDPGCYGYTIKLNKDYTVISTSRITISFIGEHGEEQFFDYTYFKLSYKKLFNDKLNNLLEEETT